MRVSRRGILELATALAVAACSRAPASTTSSPSRPADWAQASAAARGLATAGEQAVLDALEARARDTLSNIHHASDRASWQRSVPELRRRLLASLGLDRLPKPVPSRARKIATLERGAYQIDKIVYETLPGAEVPVHVYRPPRPARRLPAVLLVPGHWWPDSKARGDFQAFAINVARRGFVVLTYDPVGQGERGISFRDHRRTEALLVGISQPAITVYESLCALEHLRSLPYVDPDRIAITGASGGGYNSWLMAAVDPRIAASVPVVGTSDFLEQIEAVRPLDWYQAREHCHFLPGLLRYANNHELAALIAPRPLLVVSADRDESFPLPGIQRVVAYAQDLYRMLDRPRGFGYFEDRTDGHGYQRRKREAVYGFLLHHLKGEGDGSPVAEPPTKTEPWDSPDLRCFPAGENRPAGPAIIAHVRQLLDRPAPAEPLPPAAELRGRLAEALGVAAPAASAPSRVERGAGRSLGGLRIERLSWRAPDGLAIPAVLVAPAGAPRGAVLVAADAGKSRLLDHPGVRTAVESGLAAVLADPRGLGELAVTVPGWVFGVSLLLGESFVGRQAADLAAGRPALAQMTELRGKPIGVMGIGPTAAMAALYAAVLDPAFAWLIQERGFVSYRSFIDRERSMKASYALAAPGLAGVVRAVVTTNKSLRDSYLLDGDQAGNPDRVPRPSRDGLRRAEPAYAHAPHATPAKPATQTDVEIPHDLFVFDVLSRFDLPDLAASLAPRPALVIDPIDGDFAPLSEGAARGLASKSRFMRTAPPDLALGPAAAERLRAFFAQSGASAASEPDCFSVPEQSGASAASEPDCSSVPKER